MPELVLILFITIGIWLIIIFWTLNLIILLKQQNKLGKTKQINIKSRTYYFYNNQINLKDFDARLLKVDKKNYKEIDIY